MTNAVRIQGIVIGILLLLLLLLGSLHVRLLHQMEGDQGSRPKTAAKVEDAAPTETVPGPAPSRKAVAPSLATETAKPDDPPTAAVSPKAARKDDATPLTLSLNGGTFTLGRGKREDGLNLTEGQRKAIEEIRKNRDAQAKVFKEQIKRIDEQTDQAIRQLLTPEQVAKYDAPQDTVQAFVQPAPDPAPTNGARPGWLGISGDDAPGGGARITDVTPGSAASRFGLLKDDVILAVNGQPVTDLGELAQKIQAAGEGAFAQIKIRRAGSEFTQAAQLGGRPK